MGPLWDARYVRLTAETDERHLFTRSPCLAQGRIGSNSTFQTRSTNPDKVDVSWACERGATAASISDSVDECGDLWLLVALPSGGVARQSHERLKVFCGVVGGLSKQQLSTVSLAGW